MLAPAASGASSFCAGWGQHGVGVAGADRSLALTEGNSVLCHPNGRLSPEVPCFPPHAFGLKRERCEDCGASTTPSGPTVSSQASASAIRLAPFYPVSPSPLAPFLFSLFLD